jgi:hypothetical protein
MADDPLKGIKVFLGAVAFALGAIPTIVNIYAVIYFTPLGFQRLGSIWIALVLLVLGGSRYVVSDMNRAVHGRGPHKDIAAKKLGGSVYSEDKGWLNYMNSEGVEFERPLRTWEEIQELTDDLVDYVQARLQPTEISVGVAATLQWGYGDLIFCFLHGKGWMTC